MQPAIYTGLISRFFIFANIVAADSPAIRHRVAIRIIRLGAGGDIAADFHDLLIRASLNLRDSWRDVRYFFTCPKITQLIGAGRGVTARRA